MKAVRKRSYRWAGSQEQGCDWTLSLSRHRRSLFLVFESPETHQKTDQVRIVVAPPPCPAVAGVARGSNPCFKVSNEACFWTVGGGGAVRVEHANATQKHPSQDSNQGSAGHSTAKPPLLLHFTASVQTGGCGLEPDVELGAHWLPGHD